MNFRIVVFLGIFVFNSYSGLVSSQILPASERLIRILTVACDGGMVLLAVTAVYRRRDFYGTKSFALFLLFALVTVIYALDSLSPVIQLNGLRPHLFFFSSLIVAHDLLSSDRREQLVRWFVALLVVFAIAQFPTSLQQNLKYGAGDEVGGTYGLTGGSGHVTQLLFLIAFFLLVRYGTIHDGSSFAVKKIILFSLVLATCMLNETKVSFVLFVAYAVLLLGDIRPSRLIALGIIGVGGLYAMFHFYDQIAGKAETFLDERVLERYLFHDSRQNIDIPRFQKILLMFDVLRRDVMTFFFGVGYGIFGGGQILDVSRLSRSLFYFSGSRGLVVGLWLQGGVVAVLTYAGALFAFLRGRRSLRPTELRFALFIAAQIVLIWFYSEAVLDRTFAVVICTMMQWVYTGGDTAGKIETDPGDVGPGVPAEA